MWSQIWWRSENLQRMTTRNIKHGMQLNLVKPGSSHEERDTWHTDKKKNFYSLLEFATSNIGMERVLFGFQLLYRDGTVKECIQYHISCCKVKFSSNLH